MNLALPDDLRLAPLDRALAERLGRRSGDTRPPVLAGVALASHALRAGHVFVDLAAWAGRCASMPPVPAWRGALLESPLCAQSGDSRVAPLVLDGEHLYLARSYAYELELTEAIGRRLRLAPLADVEAARAQLDAHFPPDPSGTDRQRLAAALATSSALLVVTGGPGTGKTTTVRKILAVLQALSPERPLRVALAAPTGKAAARLTESVAEAHPQGTPAASSLVAQTLHRLLGLRLNSADLPRHHRLAPLPHDLVVVDEASMIDMRLMVRLFDALSPRTRLILLGDRHQLASVEAGTVLGDLCRAAGAGVAFSDQLAARLQALGCEGAEGGGPGGVADHLVVLERVYRFGAESAIGRLSQAVNAGDPSLPGLLGELHRSAASSSNPDFQWLHHGHDPALRERVVTAWGPFVRAVISGEAPEHVLSALEKARVLCALRRGDWGIEGMGARVARWLSEAWPAFRPFAREGVGLPLLVTENDPATRLSNGDIGVVLPDSEGVRVAWFPAEAGAARSVSLARLPAHAPAFALTIHKSQGSQFEHAIVVLPPQDSPVLCRELLYTGITRARARLTLVGAPDIVALCASRPVRRASALAERLGAAAPGESG